MKLSTFLTITALLALYPSFASAQTTPTPAIRAFDIATIERLGRAIYEQDRFAWVGTDALLAAVPQERLAGGVGWIVVEQGDAHVVRFGQGDVAAPTPFYDITFHSGADPVVTEAGGTFSETEQQMFRATALARQGVTQPCSANYNFVVLPDVDGDGWLAWAFAATTDPDAIPFGGHYRFTVSQDGRTIEQADRLSRACLVMDRNPPEMAGASSVMLSTVHLVSSTPTESYVFISLSNQIPIMVLTPDRNIWGVMGDDVSIQGVLPED